MPFGLTNVPATFQRLMNHVLEILIPTKCTVYIDNVLLYGKTIDKYLKNLELVLERIKEVGLKRKPAKCKFFHVEVNFLVRII